MVRGGKRPGSGRKPLPAEQRRAARVQVSLTLDEYQQLESLAGEQGKSLASYLHDLAVAHLRRLSRRKSS